MAGDSNRDRIKVAVVGCGPIGALHAAAVRRSPDAELLAVCDVDRTRAEELAGRMFTEPAVDLRSLLDTTAPDAVTVATPDHLHAEPTLEAIARGCHVFCEKPLALGSPEALHVVEAAERRGVSLAVDHNRRFGFGYRKARDLIDEGRIGPVRSLTIEVADRTPRTSVAREPAVMLTTLLTHHVDLVDHLGGSIVEVFARSGATAGGDGRLLREIVLSSSLENGAVATVVGSYQDGLSRTAEHATITGETGTLAVRDVTREVRLTNERVDDSTVFVPDPFGDGDAFEATIGAHLLDFLARIRSGRTPAVSGIDALRALRVLDAARESLRRGAPARVER